MTRQEYMSRSDLLDSGRSDRRFRAQKCPGLPATAPCDKELCGSSRLNIICMAWLLQKLLHDLQAVHHVADAQEDVDDITWGPESSSEFI